MTSCFKSMKKSNKISNKISNLEDIFEPRPESFTESVSILKNGKKKEDKKKVKGEKYEII